MGTRRASLLGMPENKYSNHLVQALLDAGHLSKFDAMDLADLAMACLDQANFSLRDQARIQRIMNEVMS